MNELIKNRNQFGNVKIRQLDGLLQIELESFIISISAVLRKDKLVNFRHKPFVAPNFVLTEQQAYEAGWVEVKKVFPENDGFTNHSVVVRAEPFVFDINMDSFKRD
jgi:hypothetical protein